MSVFEGVNFETPEGRKLKVLLQERLDSLRKQNDNVEMGERQTAVLRGGIQELKTLLAGAKLPVQVASYNNPNLRDRG